MNDRGGLATLPPLLAVVTLPVAILAAVFYGTVPAFVVIVVGWLLLTPASAVLFGAPSGLGSTGSAEDAIEAAVEERIEDRVGERIGTRSEGRDGPTGDPIETLRDRYARGEIDERELERRLDALLELQDLDPDDEAGIERMQRILGTDDGDRSSGNRSAGDHDADPGSVVSEGTDVDTNEEVRERE